MCRLRSRQAGRQIKQPSRPSQKNRCSLPVLPRPIWLCALQPPVFKATAGGDTLSPAPWLLYKTSPVYLPSAGITLNTHLSHAARLGKSLLCLSGSITVYVYVCVCVVGTEGECVIKRTIVFVCLCVSVTGGFISTYEATFIRKSVLFGTESILFLLVTARSVIVLAATSIRTGEADSVCCGDRAGGGGGAGCITGRHRRKIIFLL